MIRIDRLKSREKEWEEQGGGRYKRRTQLGN
jgi:hypothetical protein